MSGAVAEIFRSPRRAVCDERAFVLSAVGIQNVVAADETDFVLLVDTADEPQAAAHLAHYEQEIADRAARAHPPAPRLHPHAWMGCVAYAAVLFVVAFSVSGGLWRLDAFDAGELDAARVQSGEWWRVWTALTLHLDGPHLAANTVAGIWFGYLAARLIGVGNAWLLVSLGAGLANWIEAWFGPAAHRAVGASTAVFVALGLLSAYSWQTRFRFPQRWAARWGPLIAGILLLAWTGSGGEGTEGQGIDVVAHALGFAVGVLLGVIVAGRDVGHVLERIPQWLTGVMALTPIIVSWAMALTS